MTRKLKASALALFAALAMGGVLSPSASAVEFFSESGETDLNFRPDSALQVFEFGGTTAECAELNLTGLVPKNKMELLAGAGSFTECEFLGVETAMKTENCGFYFTENNTIDVVNRDEKKCAEKPMTIKAKHFGGAECDVKIENQNGINGVTYATVGEGANREITITMKANNIQYTTTSKNGGCEEGFKNDGVWEGKMLVTGMDWMTEKMIGIFTE